MPTLTEFADEPEQEPTGDEASSDLPNTPDAAETASPEPMAEIQDTPAQADTWGEELQARMGKLNGDIQTLNARLDRLEERNKTKV